MIKMSHIASPSGHLPPPPVCRLVLKLWDGPGSVMAIVDVTLHGGAADHCLDHKDGAEELYLSQSDQVTILIKSTEVMLAVE